MEATRGRVVLSLRGRDAGRLLAVMRTEDGYALVCDGKERPLESPKRKNLKHLRMTHVLLSEEQMATNRQLRRALSVLTADGVKGGN